MRFAAEWSEQKCFRYSSSTRETDFSKMADLLRGGQIGTAFRIGSGRFSRRSFLLGGKEDKGPLSWTRHSLVLLAIIAAIYLLLKPSSSNHGAVNLGDFKALSSALQHVDSEWHTAQQLQEELRLERSELLQVREVADCIDLGGRSQLRNQGEINPFGDGFLNAEMLPLLSIALSFVHPQTSRHGQHWRLRIRARRTRRIRRMIRRSRRRTRTTTRASPPYARALH